MNQNYRAALKNNTWLYMLILCAIALFVRVECLGFVSSDYDVFVKMWISGFRADGFGAVATMWSDYTPLYLYFMYFLSLLPAACDLYSVKALSIAFDLLLAWGGMELVSHYAGKKRGLWAFPALLLLPTVWLNSSMWAQCDAIFSSLLVWAFFFLIKNKPAAAMLLAGISLSLKIQTVFFLPVTAVFWLFGRLKLKYFAILPLPYFISFIPQLLAGKPPIIVLNAYFLQASRQTGHLSYTSASMFSLLNASGDSPEAAFLARFGVFCAAVFVLFILYKAFEIRKNPGGDNLLLAMTAALVTAIPFFLPYMHDRYFYLAEVFLLLWALARPGFWIICPAALVQIASLNAYNAYLKGVFYHPKGMMVSGLATLAALLMLIPAAINARKADLLVSEDIREQNKRP